MPTVPRLSSPQVQQSALPNARVNVDAPIEAFGGGQSVSRVFGAVSDIGENIARHEVYEKHQADDIRTKSAYKDGLALKNTRELEAKSKQGQDAFGVLDEYAPLYKKDLDKIEEGLANSAQKAQFQLIRQSLEADLDGSLKNHIFTQGKKFADETNLGGVEALKTDSVLHYHTSGLVASNLKKQAAFLEGYAKDNGLSGDAKTVFIHKALSETHTAVAERMLNNHEDIAAKAYVESQKDNFTPDDLKKLEGALRVGTVRGESRRLADGFVASSKNMGEALDKAKDITDTDVLDATKARIREEYAIRNAAKEQEQDALFQDSWNKVSKAKSLDVIAPSVLAKLSPQQQKALGGALHLRETNLEKFYNFQQMAADPDRRAEFLKLKFSDLAPHLSEHDMKTVGEWQAGLRRQDGKTLSDLDGIQTNSQIRDGMMLAAGIDPTPKPGSGAMVSTRVKNMVDKRIAEEFSRTGKKPSNADVKSIMDDVLKQVITSRGYLWNSTKPVYNLEPGESFDLDLKDVPRADIEKIDTELKRRGKTPTDAIRLELYKAKLKRVSGG